ncbi:uncharacterized protein LOC143183006 [Calliopsis andreniformis]|uniref:uncharacterized protein LOC143183006 n=1 Tax=Calliopsis andreniformis TaxID=337506 RepID=UPI003FCC5B38
MFFSQVPREISSLSSATETRSTRRMLQSEFFFLISSPTFRFSSSGSPWTSGASTMQNEHSAFIRTAQRYPVSHRSYKPASSGEQPNEPSRPASQPATPRRD